LRGRTVNIKLDKLIIVIFLALLLLATFIFNLLKTKEYLSKRRIINNDIISIFKSTTQGNSALLGKTLLDLYSPNSTFTMATNITREKNEAFYQMTRLNMREMSLFAYPLKITHEEYNSFLNEEEFDLLKKKSIHSISTLNLNFHFLKSTSSNEEMTLFIYKNNLFIVPIS